MSHSAPSRRRGHAHEQHLVVVQRCERCGRFAVMRGWVDQAAAFHDLKNAQTYAARLLREMTGRPDPAPLHLEVAGVDRAAAVVPTPAASIEPPAAA